MESDDLSEDEIKDICNGMERTITWYRELGNTCREISKLCDDNLEILQNPMKLIFNCAVDDQIEKNTKKIQLQMMSLMNLGYALTNDEEKVES